MSGHERAETGCDREETGFSTIKRDVNPKKRNKKKKKSRTANQRQVQATDDPHNPKSTSKPRILKKQPTLRAYDTNFVIFSLFQHNLQNNKDL